MIDAKQFSEMVDSDTIQSLDISMFSHKDMVNSVLQRSEVLFDLDHPGLPIRQWSNGDPRLLNKEIDERGTLYLRRVISALYLEFQKLNPTLKTLPHERIADIGCGYGFIDLFIAREYGASLTLIDLEDNDATHFGFKAKGAAYSSLETAKNFLIANGVPSSQVQTLNPDSSDPAKVKNIDLAMSLLSCGFHYPVSTYANFWENSVTPDGAIILDLRGASGETQLQELIQVGAVRSLWKGEKSHRILVQKFKN